METEEIPVIAYDEVQQLILSYFPDGIIEWRLWKLEDKDSDCNGVKPQSLMTQGSRDFGPLLASSNFRCGGHSIAIRESLSGWPSRVWSLGVCGPTDGLRSKPSGRKPHPYDDGRTACGDGSDSRDDSNGGICNGHAMVPCSGLIQGVMRDKSAGTGGKSTQLYIRL